ncbi:MAG: superoxide dismutase family protein [Bacteroidota bacterium]|nr:superoxide dismutase family protein [Bacteroidota bacterium]MDP4226464.1 superoxide dismutase family protein [Bacteroidota bacterium]MDP4275936.1 superoxide dismutase family protein [Bacteroidota bacterium]
MKILKKMLLTAFWSLIVVIVFNFPLNGQSKKYAGSQTTIQKAVCVLYPTENNQVSGIVTFTRVANGIKIVADVQGLTKGRHGFHIHECGDCSSSDAISAGGHFNPEGQSHGSPNDKIRHAGDMGNLQADDTGKAHLEYIDHVISFSGRNSIIGRSVIIHMSEDDLKSQPTGNAGSRVACGVIGISK